MKNDAQAAIAHWLWKYYEYGLPDTPGRMAKGIMEHLQASGLIVIANDDPMGAPGRESNRGVTNDGIRDSQ